MPNNCYCVLSIYDEEQIEAVVSAIRGEDTAFDFDRLIPYPSGWRQEDDARQKWDDEFYAIPRDNLEAQKQYIAEHGKQPDDAYNTKHGFEWCCLTWGTKWNAYDIEVESHTVSELIINFHTAWKPPLPIIDLLAAMFPNIESMTFEYYESGMSFCGSIRYSKGKRCNEARSEYYGRLGG